MASFLRVASVTIMGTVAALPGRDKIWEMQRDGWLGGEDEYLRSEAQWHSGIRELNLGTRCWVRARAEPGAREPTGKNECGWLCRRTDYRVSSKSTKAPDGENRQRDGEKTKSVRWS